MRRFSSFVIPAGSQAGGEGLSQGGRIVQAKAFCPSSGKDTYLLARAFTQKPVAH